MQPNLECSACFNRFKEFGMIPDCKTDKGCEIYDLATSMKIRSLILGFMRFKRMNSANLPEFLQMQCLKDSGILEIGYDLIIELETVYREFLEYEREQAETKARLKSVLNSEKGR